eukprot:CAMPEP_0115749650 /NCGR_PEP_ID=MMETSP0272-20121206/94299_1 /TAXON_ID=71861 /ORGANISM="Scrippsiella trochoidea, Strain CCMP3099" /LENGTH=443 /DNA_ID=CAMNT_0003194703 /DNA_START=44 /DNA_END=1373 /DNA_ORIENTATION=+
MAKAASEFSDGAGTASYSERHLLMLEEATSAPEEALDLSRNCIQRSLKASKAAVFVFAVALVLLASAGAFLATSRQSSASAGAPPARPTAEGGAWDSVLLDALPPQLTGKLPGPDAERLQQPPQKKKRLVNDVEFIVHSKGTWCKSGHPFLFAGNDTKCQERCIRTPGCMYATTYPGKWCQRQFAQRPSGSHWTASLLEQDWDFIVLQDHSTVPLVKGARWEYLYPAVDDFVARKKQAKLVLYMTWAPAWGSPENCPLSTNAPCFPKGPLSSMIAPPCATNRSWADKMSSFGCATYALARGYLSASTRPGVDLVVPAGLAWQVARGDVEIPPQCKAAIDAEYPDKPPLDLPLPAGMLREEVLKPERLYIYSGNKPDKHPSKVGQYLNALTFYTTLFGEVPYGAAPPVCKENCYGNNWAKTTPGPLDPPLTADQLHALQGAAAD